MSANDEDTVGFLITAGILIAVGFATYKFVKSFGEFEKGSVVSKADLLNIPRTPETSKVEVIGGTKVLEKYKIGRGTYARYIGDTCPVCGNESPERCENGHCMICVARKTYGPSGGKCYCGKCLESGCGSWAGGDECNECN